MTISSTLLRPALEAALKVARDGESAEPPTPAPPMLKRYLSFARLPGPALEIARRVVDDDPAFRRRVAQCTSSDEVGEAAWVWLSRPEGWEARLDRLWHQAQATEHANREDKAERSARRRLAGAEASARRAEMMIEHRTRERDGAVHALAAERARREQSEAGLAAAVQDAMALRDERNAAVRALKRVEAELAARTSDLRTARHQVRMLEAELAQAAGSPAPGSASPASSPSSSPSSSPASSPAPSPSFGRAEQEILNAAVAEAAEASRRLGEALGRATAALGEMPAVPAAAVSPRAVPPGADRPSTNARRQRDRVPLALPPGLFEDAPASAEHLCRVPGVIVLVDGYNVSQRAWPDRPIGEQRTRLVNALRELHARSGADIEVVFDGAHPTSEPAAGRAGGRDTVRVRFSPPGVEADDVILDLASTVPSERPLVVASSDRYVGDGARRLGANVVGAAQLLAALRR